MNRITILCLFLCGAAVPLIAQDDLPQPPPDSVLALPPGPEKVALLYEHAKAEERISPERGNAGYHRAYALARRLGLPGWIADSEVAIGQNHVILGNYDSADYYLFRSLAYYEANDSLPYVAMNLSRIGTRYVRERRFDEGTEYLLRAQEINRDIGNPRGVMIGFADLADLRSSMGDLSGAREYHQEALKMARELEDDYFRMFMAELIGTNDYQADSTTTPEPYLREALAAARRIGQQRREAIQMLTLANFYATNNRLTQSRMLLDSLRNLQGGRVPVGARKGRALLFAKAGRIAAAQAQIDSARQQIMAANRPDMLLTNQHAFSVLYREMGRYDSAYHYLNLVYQREDSLHNAALSSQAQELQTRYEVAEKEAVLEVQNAQLERQRLQLAAVGGGLLLALVAGAVFFILSRRLRRRNAENERLVGEKEVLIAEIHHRVKNNLQVISSLLSLQDRSIGPDNQEAKGALRESQSRIQAMGLIHQRLYQGTESTSIEMSGYLRDLGETLLDAYRADDHIDIFYDLAEITLDVDTAIPVGLMVNELLTNSLKYAFPGKRAGTIEVQLEAEGEEIRLVVSDDGVGGQPTEINSAGTGFGTNLVTLLSHKLRGSVRYPNGPGFCCEITFPAVAVTVV